MQGGGGGHKSFTLGQGGGGSQKFHPYWGGGSKKFLGIERGFEKKLSYNHISI